MQTNISEEIAKYLHEEVLNEEKKEDELVSNLGSVLMYNLDKERLEEALRKQLLLRILDQSNFNISRESALSEALRSYFGGKFNHRLKLLIESFSEETCVPQTQASKLSVVAIP